MKDAAIVPHSTLILMIPFVLPLGLGLDLYLPSVPSMATALATDSLHIQLTLSVFLYCFGCGQLLVGPLADRYGRKPLLYISMGLFVVGSIGCAFANSLDVILLCRACQALGASGTQVVAFAMVRDQFDGKEATFIFTSLKGAMALAPILAPILGAYLQMHYGWRANFITLSLYGVLIFTLAIFFTQETLPKKNTLYSPLQSYKTILSNGQFRYFSFCGLATQAAMFGYFSLSPRYFIDLFGLNEAQFAFFFSMNALIFLLTSIFAAKWISRIGCKQATVVGATLLLISGSSMLWGHFHYEHPLVLAAPNLLASASAAIMLGASASGAMMPFKQQAGSAAAMFGCIEFVGGGLFGSVAVISKNVTVLPLAGCLLTLGSVILLYAATLRRHNRNQFSLG